MSKTRHAQIRTFSARFSPGHVIEKHSHSWSQLLFASEGVIAVETQVACWVVPTSRAIWVPAGNEHAVKMHGRVFLQTVYFDTQRESLVELSCAAYEVPPLLRELIVFACKKGIINGDTEEHRCLIKFLTLQVKKLRPFPLMIPMPQDERARSLALQVINDPNFEKSLREVCDGCGASLRTMQRIFAKEIGMPLSRWRNQVKMVHAVQLLASGKTITQIALDLGFESVSAFVFSFRQYFGVSPGQYRSKQVSQN